MGNGAAYGYNGSCPVEEKCGMTGPEGMAHSSKERDHSCCGRFGPLRNRPPVFWCHVLESWLQDGENREKTRKNGAKMGEIWPKKKSAGCPSIIEGSVRTPVDTTGMNAASV